MRHIEIHWYDRHEANGLACALIPPGVLLQQNGYISHGIQLMRAVDTAGKDTIWCSFLSRKIFRITSKLFSVRITNEFILNNSLQDASGAHEFTLQAIVICRDSCVYVRVFVDREFDKYSKCIGMSSPTANLAVRMMIGVRLEVSAKVVWHNNCDTLWEARGCVCVCVGGGVIHIISFASVHTKNAFPCRVITVLIASS